MTTEQHDHDKGFQHDRSRWLSRRAALSTMAGVGAVLATPQSVLAACMALPPETAGPFPADGAHGRNASAINVLTSEGVIREDLRTSFAGLTPVAQGAPLSVEIRLVRAGENCTPLAGHALYLWHCDTVGYYSIYDEADRNYLRGVGITDADGVVRFTTIIPGCYDGRWPHMHFEVFDSPRNMNNGRDSLLISQFALPENVSRATYEADSRYSNGIKNLNRISLSQDIAFRDNASAAMAAQTLQMSGSPTSGFSGTITIGLA
ncbi:protocatechuate 3,4-dioxygenase beta subunit [Yoonia maritima]|uniref:Protocatechuate 3,4-dioxygenase beta subunit n=1 Tax=Yoonia maritima TaxID=1435347 RepID=A0A2T0VTL2_9RHOB|nr:intradiol ring-cleavage dioxygenase [Yoonia maritima]PRY74396.1 protocatechuate 3,4-dioxygenase beta subunit [Yoonia maritima]